MHNTDESKVLLLQTQLNNMCVLEPAFTGFIYWVNSFRTFTARLQYGSLLCHIFVIFSYQHLCLFVLFSIEASELIFKNQSSIQSENVGNTVSALHPAKEHIPDKWTVPSFQIIKAKMQRKQKRMKETAGWAYY